MATAVCFVAFAENASCLNFVVFRREEQRVPQTVTLSPPIMEMDSLSQKGRSLTTTSYLGLLEEC